MKCSEFQKDLPEIIDGGANAEQEEHRRSCPVCSDLVADLNAIAEQAKLLVPMVDPPERVWEGIQRALEREGARRPVPSLTPAWFVPSAWTTVVRWGSLAALFVLAAGLLLYRAEQPPVPAVPQQAAVLAVPAPLTTADDQRLLAAVAGKNPAAQERYRRNLENVNRAIRDARRSVENDPTDEDAQEYLHNAYDQKALIYDMAMTRTTQTQ